MPLKCIPRSKSGASKSPPRWAAHTRIGSLWEYPPPSGVTHTDCVGLRSFEETTCSARYILHLQDWTSAVDHVPVRNSNYEGQSSLTSIGLYKQHIWSFSGCEYDAIDTHIMLRARNFVTKILCWRSPVGVPACAHWTFLCSFYFPILKHLCHSASTPPVTKRCCDCWAVLQMQK